MGILPTGTVSADFRANRTKKLGEITVFYAVKDQAFCEKKLTGLQNIPSQMFDGVLNTALQWVINYQPKCQNNDLL